MSAVLIYVVVGVAILVLGGAIGLIAFVNGRKQPKAPPADRGGGVITEERPPGGPGPLEAPTDEVPDEETGAPVTTLERPEGTAGRLVRLRQRLSRSQGGLGRGLLLLLSRDRLDEDTWEEIEDTLITADVGVGPTTELVERLRTRLRVEGSASQAHDVLREELLALVDPEMDRRIAITGEGDLPGVVLVVGVNGAGKTTSVGKLARVLVAEDKTVVLGAADTFRAAATEQLSTWGERVGVHVVTGPEGSDPASVAFDSVRTGMEQGADVVVIDTAGRLQNKAGLMDELGKVKRVVEKQARVTEVLLVLDATTGQNGLVQARVFRDVVDVTGIVLTKLDGSAKGGIVVAVQRELGVPVKLVGVGEGADDLAPFEPHAFVDALLGQDQA
ncbi:signal recognition particle-docking protein FtsY [Nocardioides scoriae]|uniref:Signal recognition particle receptor FtsY n=1 Tax=Nocardioides scoriae TaxID=642780 RepID=A0A1H1YFV0_9ACTN|nr:signal recognition particle-docking protein FtsY [Nocardioides scoriae]SDT19896.1 signal recognition particle-docking protein FtsY [Nocardioides scoriae]